MLGSKYTYVLHFSFLNYKMEKKVLTSLFHNQSRAITQWGRQINSLTHTYACVCTGKAENILKERVKCRDTSVPIPRWLIEYPLKIHHFFTTQKTPLSLPSYSYQLNAYILISRVLKPLYLHSVQNTIIYLLLFPPIKHLGANKHYFFVMVGMKNLAWCF